MQMLFLAEMKIIDQLIVTDKNVRDFLMLS